VLSADLLLDADRSRDVDRLAVGSMPGAPAVIGFCETATALGHLVADAFTEAVYLHTTRRPVPELPRLLGFDEEHSHAVAHHLQPGEAVRHDADVIVLVDDELTTGMTALNTVEALEGLRPGRSYVIATLLDLRPASSREVFVERAAALGVRVDVVSLIDGSLALPDDLMERAAAFQEGLPVEPPQAPAPGPVPQPIAWPSGVPVGGRHGFTVDDREPFAAAVAGVADALPLTGGPVLVLGTEELMYAPVRLAHLLELRGVDVLVQSTTRSPVLPFDHEGYAIRRRLVFPSPDDPRRDSFLYNVTPPGAPGLRYGDIVVVVEDEIADCAALLDAIRPFADALHLVAAR
jgi:hypothetical protein